MRKGRDKLAGNFGLHFTYRSDYSISKDIYSCLILYPDG
jgi:hypothetical protein